MTDIYKMTESFPAKGGFGLIAQWAFPKPYVIDPLFTVYRSLLTIYCLPFAVYYSLFTRLNSKLGNQRLQTWRGIRNCSQSSEGSVGCFDGPEDQHAHHVSGDERAETLGSRG